MSRTRTAVIWLGLFAAALTLAVLFEDGLPDRVIESAAPLSERPVGLPERVRESWSASRNAQDQQCARGTLTGIVTYVRDGHTIEVGGVPIRLNGIAAAEANEPGGDAATAAMRAMVHGRELRCQLNGRRTYDRCVGVCYLDGEDIEAVMVRRGLARDCPRYSGGQHSAAERQAAAEGATIRRTYPLPGYCR